MTCYVLDTDHLSLYERNHPAVCQRILLARQNASDQLMTTIVSVEEQYAGRIAQIRNDKITVPLVVRYARLKATLQLFSKLDVLDYCDRSEANFQAFRQAKIRVGTQDLRIASIVMAHQAILLTRNCRDFEQLPGLIT